MFFFYKKNHLIDTKLFKSSVYIKLLFSLKPGAMYAAIKKKSKY